MHMVHLQNGRENFLSVKTGELNEVVYDSHQKGFVDPKHPSLMCTDSRKLSLWTQTELPRACPYREELHSATLLPLLGVKQMSPETLKELQDESFVKSDPYGNAEERDFVTSTTRVFRYEMLMLFLGLAPTLPEKWITFTQGLRNANHTQTLDLADIYGSTPISTKFFSNNVIHDFQENSDDEVDERSSEEYLRDLDIEYHKRALLANLKRNGYSLKDKNKAKLDKTESGIEKSVKN
ncbi:hypothetical protein Tco_1502485 [Tanacetum coccineum]